MPVDKCQKLLRESLKIEAAIEEGFRGAYKVLSNSEHQICGFEYYGIGGKHYAFKNILHNFGVELREDLNPPAPDNA